MPSSIFHSPSSPVSLVRKWAGFIRLSHTLFAMPFALAAMTVAARENRGWPGWRTFLLILAAMVCARTCAMAFNRIVDRKFDALNPRTAKRHLPLSVKMFSAIQKWASFVRLSHTVFALPFALAAMVVAARDREPRG